jgi:hypothetical protein
LRGSAEQSDVHEAEAKRDAKAKAPIGRSHTSFHRLSNLNRGSHERQYTTNILETDLFDKTCLGGWCLPTRRAGVKTWRTAKSQAPTI